MNKSEENTFHSFKSMMIRRNYHLGFFSVLLPLSTCSESYQLTKTSSGFYFLSCPTWPTFSSPQIYE